MREVKRTPSCNRFPKKVIWSKKYSNFYSIYMVGSVERKRRKKAETLNELEMTRRILSPKCTLALLSHQRNNKRNCVFGVKVSSFRPTNSWTRSRNGSVSGGNHMISITI